MSKASLFVGNAAGNASSTNWQSETADPDADETVDRGHDSDHEVNIPLTSNAGGTKRREWLERLKAVRATNAEDFISGKVGAVID